MISLTDNDTGLKVKIDMRDGIPVINIEVEGFDDNLDRPMIQIRLNGVTIHDQLTENDKPDTRWYSGK